MPEIYATPAQVAWAVHNVQRQIDALAGVTPVSITENMLSNQPPVTYLHGINFNAAGLLIAGDGETAYFPCVKGLSYKWNALTRNRSYVAFYESIPAAGKSSYDNGRADIAVNTAFVAPITGYCAVFYHAAAQTSAMKFWTVSSLSAGLDDIAVKLGRTVSVNLIGEDYTQYYPVNIPAGTFYVNVSTSDGSTFSDTLKLGLYDAEKTLINSKITLGTTLSYRDIQETTSADIAYIKLDNPNDVPLMVTVHANAVGGSVPYKPYFYDAKALSEKIVSIEESVPSYYIPAYYTSHIAAKTNTLLAMDGVDMRFGFITDAHYPDNAGHSVALMRYLWKNVPMNFIVNNGDTLVQESTKGDAQKFITKFNALFDFAGTRYYPVIGNHEHNNASGNSASTQLSLSQVRLAVLPKLAVRYSGYAAYYFDDDAANCRYYFVGAQQNGQLYSGDIVWFLQTLLTVPNKYTVIVLSHAGLSYNSGYEVTGVQFGVSSIAMGLLALANKSVYTYDHVAYNYSAVEATPIAIFSGHVHFDGNYQYTNANYNGYINVIATTCDAYGSQPIGNADRSANTVNEHAFDIISIDKTNRAITMTRIGSGSDRTFTFSDYAS